MELLRRVNNFTPPNLLQRERDFTNLSPSFMKVLVIVKAAWMPPRWAAVAGKYRQVNKGFLLTFDPSKVSPAEGLSSNKMRVR